MPCPRCDGLKTREAATCRICWIAARAPQPAPELHPGMPDPDDEAAVLAWIRAIAVAMLAEPTTPSGLDYLRRTVQATWAASRRADPRRDADDPLQTMADSLAALADERRR